MYAIISSILIHLLLILPISAKNIKKVRSHSITITNIEFVPSKVEEIEVQVVKKGMHGKKTVTTQMKTVNKKKSLKGDKTAIKYFKTVREKIIKNSSTSLKAKKLKLKGEVMAKIQIQKNGSYDILFIDGPHKELINMTNNTFSKIKSFEPIPTSLEQSEIQLKIPLHFKLSK